MESFRRGPSNPWLGRVGRRSPWCAVVGAACWALATAVAAPLSVPTVTVGPASATATATLALDGVLQPQRQATVTSQLAANVLELRVQAGERVRRGQPLVILDDRDLRAATARNDAAVAQAEAGWRNAELVRKRQGDLVRSGFVSQAALDLADSQLQAAQAALNQARAARAQAGVAQGHATLSAPFDAVVLATQVEAGDLAMPGRALLTLYEPGRLRAVVQVPASRAGWAVAADTVRIVMPDGRLLTPVASELLPTADPVSQTVEWRLDLPAEASGARPGQTVRVQFRGPPATATAARLSVPSSALLRRGELSAVYVATPGGFTLRALRLGPVSGAQVDVLAGLRAGERIAVDPVRAGLDGAMPEAP